MITTGFNRNTHFLNIFFKKTQFSFDETLKLKNLCIDSVTDDTTSVQVVRTTKTPRVESAFLKPTSTCLFYQWLSSTAIDIKPTHKRTEGRAPMWRSEFTTKAAHYRRIQHKSLLGWIEISAIYVMTDWLTDCQPFSLERLSLIRNSVRKYPLSGGFRSRK